MEEQIKDARMKFKCGENWEQMEVTGDARFCGVCQKKVYDLTDKKMAYFLQIMEENNNNVCGRLQQDQLVKPAAHEPSFWKKWTMAAMVFIGFGAAAQKADAQEFPMGKIAPSETKKPEHIREATLGIILAPEPEENASLRSLHQYLVKNCKVPATANGRLIASFGINKNGIISNISLTEQLPAPVRMEVLRAIKTAPKWKGKNYTAASSYTLHLTFKKGKIMPYGS